MLYVEKQLRLCVVNVCETMKQLSLFPQAKVPFCVYSVTSCVGIPPVESVEPLNIFNPFVSLITTMAFAKGLLFEAFVTLTSKNHFTVMLFFSTGASNYNGVNATLDLLKLTLMNVVSVVLAV